MSTHNICFYGEIRKIIPKLAPSTPPNKYSGVEMPVGVIVILKWT